MRRLLPFLLIPTLAHAQMDEGYGKKIKEATTEPFFLPASVDHLPASKTVPTPERFFGTIAGAPNVLHKSKALADYLRALAKTSDRIKVFSLGTSEEGREMVVAVVSDAANLKRLDDVKRMNGRLADPRGVSDAEAERLIKSSLPMYWCTGAMHAPESGPPEMLMELAYRLAVSEEPNVRTIRKNALTMITPVLDVDGRDRSVDVYDYRKKNPDKPPIPLVYWGKYVAHDDNRDGLTLALKMSQNLTKGWLEFHPQVMHDLHESVPFLYTSTGTGPYNAWLDPIVVSEWQNLANDEIEALTKAGVPGVWTHGFYDGWAANYGFTVANGHNAMGRFYEIFSAGGADTGIRTVGAEDTTREWYRPNPPFPSVRWSIRDNVNLSQAGLLVALERVATHREEYLRNFWLKSKRSVAKARTEGPAAYVFPQDDPGRKRQAMLLRLLQRQGVEVKRLDEAVKVDGQTIPSGSYVVRMDQPFSRMADMMLDTQYYKPSDPRPYDDTGWTLGPLFDVRTLRIKDPALLDRPMTATEFGEGAANAPTLRKPLRIALVHTWTSTQDEGWARLALDGLGVKYDYLSVHAIRDTPDLRAKYDLVLIPQTRGDAQTLVNGRQGPVAIPWRATPEYPSLGGPDVTDDLRGGLDLEGVMNLRRFVREGGTLMCVGNAARMPIDYGLVSGVSVAPEGTLNAPGGVFLTLNAAKDSPLMRGYGETLGAYFSSESMPVLSLGEGGERATPERPSGRGSLTDPDVVQGRPPYVPKAKPGDVPAGGTYKSPVTPRPRVLLRFAPKERLLISGMLDGGEALAGHPAVIDCPVGKGHVVLFGINPFWRGETVGSYQLVLNAAELLP